MLPPPASSPVPVPRRGEIWLVSLDPSRGSEIAKTRPCVVLSSNTLRALPLRTVVPMTEWKPKHARFWSCVAIDSDGRNGLRKPSAADGTQVRCVALERFSKRIGVLAPELLRDIADAVALTIEAV
ncbi:MAG TPA: type II toxin-antitoxin system PemK/MazF family toxin [Planctomycetota bacterium]|nr:type II toxin-antitoxin system PemK/MazF family toxin [Planctomycetota bacterium]